MPREWLPTRPPVIGRHKGDKIPGASFSIGRSLLTEAYDKVPSFPWELIRSHPDGVLRLSLIPLGQVGEYWLSADDQDAIYAIPWGTIRLVGLPVIVEHIKNYAAKERRV